MALCLKLAFLARVLFPKHLVFQLTRQKMVFLISVTAEFSKMKDELPESFKKGLETASEKEDSKKTTPTPDKESIPSEQGTRETTPTEEKVYIVFR